MPSLLRNEPFLRNPRDPCKHRDVSPSGKNLRIRNKGRGHGTILIVDLITLIVHRAIKLF